MASKLPVSVYTTQGSTSFSGSFSIRAPVSPEYDSSDIESNGYVSDTSSSVNIESESEAYVSGEEFESASEKLYVGDSDEEKPEAGLVFDKYKLSRPFVSVLDGETDGNSFVKSDNNMNVLRVMPIAQLSLDDDDSEELIADDGQVASGGADGGSGGIEKVGFAPKVKVSDGSDVEEDKEVDLLVESDAYAVNESELLLTGDNDVSAGKDGTFPVKVPANDDYNIDEPLVENTKNLELEEDVKHVDDSVSIDSVVEDDRDVATETREIVLENDFQLDGEAKNFVDRRLPSDNSELTNIEFNDGDWQSENSTVVNDFMNHQSVNCGASLEMEEIVAVLNACDDTKVELEELKIDDCDGESVIKPVDDESVQEIVLEPQELDVVLEAEKTADCEKNYDGSKVFEGGSDGDKLEAEIGMNSESLTREDSIGVESVNNASVIAVELLGEEDFPGKCKDDGLEEEESKRNTSFLDIIEEVKLDSQKIGGQELSDEDSEDVSFGGSGTTVQTMNELQRTSSSSYDGQIVPCSDEEFETDEDHEENKLFDPAALTALLRAAAASANLDGGHSFNLTSADGSGVFTFDRPVASGMPISPMRSENISDEEKKRTEKIHHIRVKFLRLVLRLGRSPEDFVVASLLHKLFLASGRHVTGEFSLESAKRMAKQLEADCKDNLDFCLNILVIGKTGVGKSATVNSIFGGKKVATNAFQPATTKVKEIVGTIDGVSIRIFDTPGLRCAAKDEHINRKILASIKKWTRKFPPDVVLYVDRLDSHTEHFNDMPLLASITNSLTASIWRNAVVTFTHAAAPPPDSPSGSPLSFEDFVEKQSHAVQLSISRATGDLRLIDPNMMHPVSLVENHPLCPKNNKGESVLPNGESWRTQLLLLCYSLKILSELEASSRTKPHDQNNLFGFKLRSLPLPHLLSSLLQPRPHPKLGDDDVDSDVELLDLSDSDEGEYDQLPPFKPLKKSQVNKLSKEQKKAYFDEYDYRVKLHQKKQWKEEVKRLKELKEENGKDNRITGNSEQEEEEGGPAVVPVTMPDYALPPTFDSDNPSYLYRMLEPTSEILIRPILESQGWDHDTGYDGVALDTNFAISGKFRGTVAVQVKKDKKAFNAHLDSSVSAKLIENGSTMAGLDIQTLGRQLAYTLRAETEVKNLKINKTNGGVCITLLGKQPAMGVKLEDHIQIRKFLALVGNIGAITSGGKTAYGANFEVRHKGEEFPVEQNQSTVGLSLMNYRGNLGLTANLQTQFSIGRNLKMTINVGMNNQKSGQISIKTSSSEFQTAIISILPIVISLLKSFF